jgi:hypothetical protein
MVERSMPCWGQTDLTCAGFSSPKDMAGYALLFLGEPGGIRTHDPKIKSLVLYQLSYGLAGAL